MRLEALDRLDAAISFAGPDALVQRGRELSARLEAANADLYRSVRAEIQRGDCPALFSDLLAQFRLEVTAGQWPRGNGYDFLDELIAGVFAFEEPDDDHVATQPESVFYQPTPMRHVFALIASGIFSARDVVVDLGSGLGHVAMLLAIATGARCIGVEREPSFAACARECAQGLGLDRVSFIEQDARDADFSAGTLFYLYTPFTGSTLRSVLDALHQASLTRRLTLCAFGPCAETLAQEKWLRAATPIGTDRMTVFASCYSRRQGEEGRAVA